MKLNHSKKITKCGLRYAILVFAWLNVFLGIIGILIPGMPTTVFLIIAAWAFSKCSERFHNWLWNHPRFGNSIQSWHNHRVIPKNAKILASSMMLISFVYIVIIAESWLLPILLAAIMIPAWIYIIKCKSVVPINNNLFSNTLEKL